MNRFEIFHPLKNFPCWFCSRLMGRITIGKNKGKLIAGRGIVDGHERMGHLRCFEAGEYIRHPEEVDD